MSRQGTDGTFGSALTERVGVTSEVEGAGPESRAAGERSLLRRAILSSDRRIVALN